MEQDSQRTSSVISDTPPTLQPVTISPYACVAIDTQTHSARTVNIAHPQCAITQPTISTPAADAHTTNTSPFPKITYNILVVLEFIQSCFERVSSVSSGNRPTHVARIKLNTVGLACGTIKPNPYSMPPNPDVARVQVNRGKVRDGNLAKVRPWPS